MEEKRKSLQLRRVFVNRQKENIIGANLQTISLEEIKYIDKGEHTMTYALRGYIQSKIPYQYLYKAAHEDICIHVIGIVKDRFQALCAELNWVILKPWTQPVWKKEKEGRTADASRCELYEVISKGNLIYVLTCFPGRDLTRQYGHMVRQYLDEEVLDFSEKYLLVSYQPFDRSGYTVWSGLNTIQIRGTKTLVIGYSEYFGKKFQLPQHQHGQFVWWQGQRVTFFGVRHSYWGDLVKLVLDSLFYRAKFKEIIFVGKAGLLRLPEKYDAWTSIFTPQEFKLHGKKVEIKNILQLALYQSAYHDSIATVMEERFTHQVLENTQWCASVDNELGHVAQFCLEKSVKLGAIILPSDYVRTVQDHTTIVSQTLDSNETDVLQAKRKNIQKLKTLQLLKKFFNEQYDFFLQGQYIFKEEISDMIPEAFKSWEEVIWYLQYTGKNIMSIPRLSELPFMFAFSGNIPFLSALLQLQAETCINCNNKEQHTMIWYTLLKKNWEGVELLLMHKASIEAQVPNALFKEDLQKLDQIIASCIVQAEYLKNDKLQNQLLKQKQILSKILRN